MAPHIATPAVVSQVTHTISYSLMLWPYEAQHSLEKQRKQGDSIER
jgi:hypothetical protein